MMNVQLGETEVEDMVHNKATKFKLGKRDSSVEELFARNVE